MTRLTASRVAAAALSFVCLFASAAWAADDQDNRPLSIVEFIAELDRLTSTIASILPSSPSERPAESLPSVWRIQTAERTFEIPTGALTRDLGVWRARGDETARARLLGRLRALRADTELFDRPPIDRSIERARLNDILAGREFRAVHGPTWMDRLRQRALQLVDALLGGLIRSSAFPTVSSVIVYAVVVLAVIVLGVWAYRLIQREATVEAVVRDEPAALKEWSAWLAEAQAAAADRRWRDGIHFAYWCAVSFLESTGTWRPDRARTPREYLQLVSSSTERGSSRTRS